MGGVLCALPKFGLSRLTRLVRCCPCRRGHQLGGLAYSLVAGLRVTASLAGRVQGSRVHGWELRGPGISSHLYPIPRSADVAGTRSGSWGLGVSGAPSSSDWDKSTVFCLQKCVGSPYTGGSGRTLWPPRRPPLELPRLGSGEGSAQCINPLGTHIALPLCRSLARAWLTSCAAAHAVCAGRFLFLPPSIPPRGRAAGQLLVRRISKAAAGL